MSLIGTWCRLDACATCIHRGTFRCPCIALPSQCLKFICQFTLASARGRTPCPGMSATDGSCLYNQSLSVLVLFSSFFMTDASTQRSHASLTEAFQVEPEAR